MSVGRIALGLAVVAACGGRGAAPSAHPHAAVTPGAPALVLYRDGALVRERREVEVPAGDSAVSVPLPPDVGAADVSVRVVAGTAELAELTVASPDLAPGEHVAVVDRGRTLEGTLRMVDGGAIAIEDAEGVHLVLDPRHVVRDGDRAIDWHVEVGVRAPSAGGITLEVVYLTHKLSWNADYTLVTDTAHGLAELHGALGIDNQTGLGFDHASLTLIDTARPTVVTAFDQAPEASTGKPPPVAEPTKPRAEQPARPVKPIETPHTELPFAVDVEPGVQSVSLLDGAPTLHAAQTLVFDPVGEDRNLSGREPVRDRDYGLDRTSGAVSQSIDVQLARAKLPVGLPTGQVRLLERTLDGALRPLGEARIFERAGTNTEALAPTTSVAVGRAAEVTGKRWRREYTLDEEARRLIEEFEIDLTSTADHPVEVIVREHLYRGLNWRLLYQNVEDRVSKEGPQKIALRTTVPTRGKAHVVYRVVYHW